MQKLTENQIRENTADLLEATDNENLGEVQRLLPVSDPTIYECLPLQKAVEQGCKEIVKLLISVSNLKVADSVALIEASKNGDTEIVELLIPFSDPKANNSEALRLAN